MGINEHFDAVVMLTWSDWGKEPRSNRYHYATRFARNLPVLFLQHLYAKRDGISVEASEVANIDIVNVSCGLSEQDVNDIKQLLAARGIKHPLVWIYDSLNYQRLIDALPRAFRVYHATEDYLTRTNNWQPGIEVIQQSLINMLSQVDFMVACSQGVANSYLTSGGYKHAHVVIENGCDAEYFLEHAEHHALNKATSKIPIAIFQGGINQRLDYELMLDLVKRMPDWEFRFCGDSVESEGWSRILQQTNVRYLGAVPPEDLARHMCESTVGIIPYIQDQWIRNSLPLKAYEYVACGLPVVTVPITALECEPDLMAVAKTADEFEAAIRRVADLRHDPVSLQQRRKVALTNSYNSRFLSMTQRLIETRKSLDSSSKKLRIAVLYDTNSTHVETIREHLEALDRYSKHTISFIPASHAYWGRSSIEVLSFTDLSIFDAVVVHYSVRLSIRDHLEEGLAQALEKFQCLKVLFIQDEYEGTEIARSWMDRLKFDVVYTCVPQEGLEYVYPSYRFPATEFLPTLTGYVPEYSVLERYLKPLSERKLLIAYRGRKLPAVYGELGYEKYRIGVEMKIIAGMRGLPVDIEVDNSKRIYGSAWYKFLGSARATLGTESGANVFDFDGSLRTEIKRLEVEKPEITFEEISAKVLASHEGRVLMNQISPKIFEAIRLRTALVLFEGSYSGVVRPNEHYIPLKKDFSNIDEVLAKLKDDEYLQKLTDQAYQDVVASGRFSYKSFVEEVDADIERRVLRSNTQNLLLGPLFFVAQDGSLKQALPAIPLGVAVGPHPLGYPMSLAEIVGILPNEHVDKMFDTKDMALNHKYLSGLIYRSARWFWRLLPIRSRAKLLLFTRSALRRNISVNQQQKLIFRIARRGWRLLPLFVRIRLVRLIERN